MGVHLFCALRRLTFTHSDTNEQLLPCKVLPGPTGSKSAYCFSIWLFNTSSQEVIFKQILTGMVTSRLRLHRLVINSWSTKAFKFGYERLSPRVFCGLRNEFWCAVILQPSLLPYCIFWRNLLRSIPRVLCMWMCCTQVDLHTVERRYSVRRGTKRIYTLVPCDHFQ